MIIRCARFNTYLLLMVLVALFTGCQSAETKRKKQLASIRFHLETHGDRAGHYKTISVCRGAPITLNIEPQEFLNETMISKAAVIDVNDGFAIQIEFDRRGSWLLEQYTARNIGKHFAIHSTFGAPTKETPKGQVFADGRWLAAPLVQRRLSQGLFSFTPDATKEEAEVIVLGINNAAKKDPIDRMGSELSPDPRR